MAASIPTPSQRRRAPLIIAIVACLAVLAGIIYLVRPVESPEESAVSAEAKAYVRHLELGDVDMKATENFMKQQVVEITGSITNRGDRTLQSVDIYCFFKDAAQQVVHRERVPIVRARSNPLLPNETRPFRLPFDSLPEKWNQALPQLVIAQITFAE